MLPSLALRQADQSITALGVADALDMLGKAPEILVAVDHDPARGRPVSASRTTPSIGRVGAATCSNRHPVDRDRLLVELFLYRGFRRTGPGGS